MTKLNERLKHRLADHRTVQVPDMLRAVEVCAAVEAYQAAEQEYQAALEEAASDDRYQAAVTQYAAAKARLLEVNLG